MSKILIDGHKLTIDQVYEVAINTKAHVSFTQDSLIAIKKAHAYVSQIVDSNKPTYGINTGFGALSDVHIKKEDLSKLQVNLIRSHCTGVGEPFSEKITRAIMLLRANCLASGFSGIQTETLELLLEFINHNILPIIPSQGSVGASGDLAPLSHIALCLIGEGDVMWNGKQLSSSFAIEQIGKKPIQLGPKEGLALINGTAVMTALGCIALIEGERYAKVSDIVSTLTLEAVRGTKRAFDPRITKLKPHKGQIEVCKNLNRLTGDSEISTSHTDCNKVQDPYSLRCIPQVHGACRQTLKHAREVLEVEINSVTDNPLLFVDDDDVISGGNFHGEALALCMDYLAMGLSELCNISERRVEKMMNPTFSDLPAFLIKDSGLNSGLMIAHVTMAALASENKVYCHPASVDSIPTSTDKEDHVSMGVTSGIKLNKVLNNLKNCLAIELLCSSQGLEFHRPLKTTPPLEALMELVRKHVDFIVEDRVFARDINVLADLIERNEILKSVEAVTGELR